MIGARRIISEKLREDQYREIYGKSLERKGVECKGDNVKQHVGTGKTSNG